MDAPPCYPWSCGPPAWVQAVAAHFPTEHWLSQLWPAGVAPGLRFSPSLPPFRIPSLGLLPPGGGGLEVGIGGVCTGKLCYLPLQGTRPQRQTGWDERVPTVRSNQEKGS